MPPKKTGTSPVWSDVKAKLAAFDRAGLLGLLCEFANLAAPLRMPGPSVFGMRP